MRKIEIKKKLVFALIGSTFLLTILFTMAANGNAIYASQCTSNGTSGFTDGNGNCLVPSSTWDSCSDTANSAACTGNTGDKCTFQQHGQAVTNGYEDPYSNCLVITPAKSSYACGTSYISCSNTSDWSTCSVIDKALNTGNGVSYGVVYQGTCVELYSATKCTGNTCQSSSPTNAAVKIDACSDPVYSSEHTDLCNCEYDSSGGVYNGNTYTAIGCVPANIGSLTNVILSVGIGVGAVAALIMMIIGGYEIMTNPAGPEEINEGKNYITNAILGLLVIILCVVVLKIIGVDVLGINELSNLFG